MQLPLRGIVPPLATPLTGSREAKLDVAALERLIEHVIAGGVNGVFLLGTTGEFSSLSREMRTAVIRYASGMVNGRVPVLAGISETSVPEIVGLAKVAAECGAAGLVLAAPYYFQHSQDDLLYFLERVCEQVPLPVFLYNIPGLTKTSFEPETVARAAQMERIVGLKDSTGDLNYLAEVIRKMGGRTDFSILLGPEELLLPGMRGGAIGGVCGGANLNPRLFVELYEAASAGDETRASRLQDQVLRIAGALYGIGAPGGSYLKGIKGALSLAGICRPEPAAPFAPFSREEFAELTERYRSLEDEGLVPKST